MVQLSAPSRTPTGHSCTRSSWRWRRPARPTRWRSRHPQETRELWSGDHVVVAVDGDTVLGSAKMHPNRPAQGAHVGTASFMVGSAARGRGLGRALAQYAVDWHRAQGFHAIQFNAVVSTNTAAIRLWQSLGFEIVGTVPEAFRLPSGEYADLHVMHLAL